MAVFGVRSLLLPPFGIKLVFMSVKYKSFWGVILGGAVVLTIGLYYWMRSPTVLMGDTLAIGEGTPEWVREWEAVRLAHLEDSLRDVYHSIQLSLNRAHFWESHSAGLLAGYYYYRAAQETNDTALWRKAGLYLFESAPLADSIALPWVTQASIYAYESLLKEVPGDLDSRTRLGALLVESGQDVMRGIGYLREVLDVNPDHPLALLYMGVFSVRSGQYEKARERFLRLLNLQPQNEVVHYYLAHVYQVLDSMDAAVHHLESWKSQVGDPVLQRQIDSLIIQLKK